MSTPTTFPHSAADLAEFSDAVLPRLLPSVPDAHGFAGAFAGVSSDVLLVAGGANFPDVPLAEGGTKVWHDRVFVLDRPDGEWREVGRLPGPLGYGVSVNTDEGLLCIGGSDVERHRDDCFLLKLNGGSLETVAYPSLPVPLANMAGARLGDVVYVVGGTSTPADTTACGGLFALDLNDLSAGWKSLEPVPGPGRILATVAAQSNALFVVSGASLSPDANGNPARTYLKDAWRYDVGAGWSAISDIPRSAVAAPSSAPLAGDHGFLIVGGDDGSQAGIKHSVHPGFSRSILMYRTDTDRWESLPDLPETFQAPVTTVTTEWERQCVIVSGEVRPGIRSPQVLSLEFIS